MSPMNFEHLRRKALVALLALLGAAIVGVTAIGIVLTRDPGNVADEPQVTQPPAEPEVERAVRDLMATFGLTREEAEQYLQWNGRVDDVRETLAPHLPAVRLVGTWVEYTPGWTLVIALRGPAPPPTALSEAVAYAPLPVEIRLDPGSPDQQLRPILEAELEARGGHGWISFGTIYLFMPPPDGVAADALPAVQAELKVELEARYGVRFDVRFGYVVWVDTANA